MAKLVKSQRNILQIKVIVVLPARTSKKLECPLMGDRWFMVGWGIMYIHTYVCTSVHNQGQSAGICSVQQRIRLLPTGGKREISSYVNLNASFTGLSIEQYLNYQSTEYVTDWLPPYPYLPYSALRTKREQREEEPELLSDICN
jgi:hypothetical protein